MNTKETSSNVTQNSEAKNSAMQNQKTQNNAMPNNEAKKDATQNKKMPNKKTQNNAMPNNEAKNGAMQNQKTQNNKIPMDEMLQKAAEEYANALWQSLPKPEDCDHVFSKEFEEKIKELKKRKERSARSVWYPAALKIAAVILLFLLVSAASLLTVSETARAELLGWLFRQQPVETQKPKKEKKLAYPTVAPVPEFTPTEEQTGLLLLIENGDARGDFLDQELVDTLNNYLQEKGYSFYLDVRWLSRDASNFETFENGEAKERSTLWSELAAGVKPDFISVSENSAVKAGREWKSNFEREVTEGLLLPFSEYPDTPAARELLSLYPEEYKKFSSFQGECYGWSLSNRLVQYGIYLNIDNFKRTGLPVPEELDFEHLDELLKTAKENGIPASLGIRSVDTLVGLERLSCGLYLKHKSDGGVVFVNPLEDEETLRLLEALYRYKENGWLNNWSGGVNGCLIYKGGISLDILEDGTDGSEASSMQPVWNGFVLYKELPVYRNEGSLYDFLAITRMSEHKEEAVELLNLLFTDEEVIRIMRYGYEGFHYVMGKDGPQEFMGKGMKKTWKGVGEEVEVVYNEEVYVMNPPLDFSFGNTKTELFGEADWGRKSRADRLAAQIENIIVSPYVCEFTSVQEKMLKRIAQKGVCQRILTLNSKNYEEDLQRARKDMANMAYDRLVRQMNARYGFTSE